MKLRSAFRVYTRTLARGHDGCVTMLHLLFTSSSEHQYPFPKGAPLPPLLERSLAVKSRAPNHYRPLFISSYTWCHPLPFPFYTNVNPFITQEAATLASTLGGVSQAEYIFMQSSAERMCVPKMMIWTKVKQAAKAVELMIRA